MSLTTDDLTQIRTIIRDEVRPIISEEVELQIAPISREITEVSTKVDNLSGEVKALRSDVKTIYNSLDRAGIAVTE